MVFMFLKQQTVFKCAVLVFYVIDQQHKSNKCENEHFSK